jgi:hypothetical protein
VYLIAGGNDSALGKLRSAATIVVSIGTVYASTMLAYLVQVDAFVFDTTVPYDDTTATTATDYYYQADDATVTAPTQPPSSGAPSRRPLDTLLVASLAIGFVCMLAQLVQLIRVVLPRNLDAPRLFEFALSSANQMERQTKTAASHKVRQMLLNAASCHSLPPNPVDNQLAASLKYDAKNGRRLLGLNSDGRISHAMFQFQQKLLERETVGGFLYTIKGLVRGNPLATKEGIWFFPRLLWCHLGQWIVIAALVVLLVQLPITFSEGFAIEGISLQQYVR